MKIVAGILLALLLGAACRWFDLPVPSPPKLLGALIVLAITTGYVLTDRLIGSPTSSPTVTTEAPRAGSGPAEP